MIENISVSKVCSTKGTSYNKIYLNKNVEEGIYDCILIKK